MQKPNNDGLPIAGAQVVPVIQLVEFKGFLFLFDERFWQK
jgi:hypothetical protein